MTARTRISGSGLARIVKFGEFAVYSIFAPHEPKFSQAPRKSPWRLVPKIGHFPVFCPSHFRRNLSKLHLASANFSKNCPDFRNRPSGGPKCVRTAGFGLLRAQNLYISSLHDPTARVKRQSGFVVGSLVLNQSCSLVVMMPLETRGSLRARKSVTGRSGDGKLLS